MSWRLVARKRTARFSTSLYAPAEPGAGWWIDLARRDNGSVWRGAARFPDEMGEEARHRFGEVRDDVSLEDLVREWGAEDDELDAFQAFLGEVDP